MPMTSTAIWGQAMTKINNMDPGYRDVLAEDFEKAMDAAYRIFGREGVS